MSCLRLQKVQKRVHIIMHMQILSSPKIYRIKTKQARFPYNLSQHLIARPH